MVISIGRSEILSRYAVVSPSLANIGLWELFSPEKKRLGFECLTDKSIY